MYTTVEKQIQLFLSFPQNIAPMVEYVKNLSEHDGIIGTLSSDIYFIPHFQEFYVISSKNSTITNIRKLDNKETKSEERSN